MSLVTGICADNTLTLHLVDRLDSTTAADVEEEIEAIRSDAAYDTIVIDCSKLTYVSSAGLRVLLRLKKSFPNLSLIEASTEVYEVFDMTGLVEIMDIQKAYRRISVDGCKVVGEGASGKIYRIAPDTVVKVFESDVSLDEIQLSRELSRKAFVWGIPTAIPYDVVRVGEHYGAVYELLDAENLAQAIAHGELTVSEVAVLSADLLKQIHGTEVATNMLPTAKAVGLGRAGRLKRHLPAETADKLLSLMDALPDRARILHGDYHLKNIMLQDGEALLIDMDTLCYGHPIFDFASMFNAYVGFGCVDHTVVERFMGISSELTQQYWDEVLRLYFAEQREQEIAEIERKIMVVGYTHLMDRAYRRNRLDSEETQAFIACCAERLVALLEGLDTLEF